MSDEGVVENIVTKFLLNTCRLRPQPSDVALRAVAVCAVIASEHPDDDEDVESIPLITGSVAEFYIEPMLRHIGDIDAMPYDNDELAIPRGHPPPTQLPAEYHSYVRVYEMVDSDLSAYVYLERRYSLTKCTDSGRYNATEYEQHGVYLSRKDVPYGHAFELHGPARKYPGEHDILPIDIVQSVRCFLWPPQADGWPSRHKNYGWPNSATVDHIVRNGCDVVQVAHHLCRQDEWMSIRQFRLSFSRAEIVLLNSWMPVQQIVYHLLRVFMKTSQLMESDSNSGVSTLSNYHIKTLMLWACELKPRSWWIDHLSFIRICIELLHTLAVWLVEARYPHYFVNRCNLVDNSFALEMTASRLLLTDKHSLSSWFVTDYIRQSARICPEHVSRLFDDVITTIKLETAVSAIVNWRQNTTKADMLRAFALVQYDIALYVSVFSMSASSCVCWITELSKIDWRLSVYFIAVAFLHIAHKIGRGSSIDKVVKSLPTSHFLVSSNYYNELTLLLLDEVVTVARKCQQLAANSGDIKTPAFELVRLLQQSAVEHHKTFRQLLARDFGSESTTVATDLEVLYAYKNGNYQQCLHLSTQNIHALLCAECILRVPTIPEFIQFLDDDIVSLIALTLIINPSCRDTIYRSTVCPESLSLYLITQCQLKLGHSLTSLAQTLDKVTQARRYHKVRWTLEHLILKLTERKLVTHITKLIETETAH